MKDTGLDRHKDAYKSAFKFHDENVQMLSWYGQRMLGRIKEKGGKSLLSLGIGHKVISEKIIAELRNVLDKYIILEGSHEILNGFMREIALPPNVHLVEGFFEEYVLEGRVDAVEMGFVLEHVDDPLSLVKKYSNFLRPGGTLFITVPNATSLHRQVGKHAGLMDDLYSLSDSDMELGHKRYFDLQILKQLVFDAGMKIIALEGIFLKPFSTSQLQKMDLLPEVMNALFAVGVRYPELCNAIYLEATLGE